MADTDKLGQAFDRFDAALRQFDAALSRRNQSHARLAAVAAEAEGLKRENAAMKADMKKVTAKADDLAKTGIKAAGKIDTAMSRIRAVLHSNSVE
ncbi:MAG TPA: DUF4164 family protein [Aestuariivirga sp.]|jgi:seryl-tRNA synthetase|nr:DUF4164 family protein [Aestuariivirga sp.]